jgi:hypothetical protein
MLDIIQSAVYYLKRNDSNTESSLRNIVLNESQDDDWCPELWYL